MEVLVGIQAQMCPKLRWDLGMICSSALHVLAWNRHSFAFSSLSFERPAPCQAPPTITTLGPSITVSFVCPLLTGIQFQETISEPTPVRGDSCWPWSFKKENVSGSSVTYFMNFVKSQASIYLPFWHTNSRVKNIICICPSVGTKLLFDVAE